MAYNPKLNRWKTITPTELADLELNELKPIVRRMQTLANNRLKRLDKAGLGKISPAVRANSYLRYNDTFRAPKETKQQYRAAYQTLKGFLNASTSTVTGGRKWYTRQQKVLGELTEDELSQFWRVYNAAASSSALARIFAKLDSNQIRDMARTAFTPGASFMENLNAVTQIIEANGNTMIPRPKPLDIDEYEFLKLNGGI